MVNNVSHALLMVSNENHNLPLVMFWFYGISNIVGYLMPNPVYTYILNIYGFVNISQQN